MKEIKSLLKTFLHKEEEIKVFLYLLEKGESGVQEIARGLSLHRPRVYETLSVLLDKGFVEELKVGKRIHYKAVQPYFLLEKVKSIESDVHKLLPELQKIKDKQTKGISMEVLRGETGLAACFLDVVMYLKKDDIFYRISSAKDQQYVDSVVPKHYRPIRDSKNLERRVITSRYVGEQKKARLERSIRYFDEQDELFEHNVIQFIYGDKISLLDFNSLTGTIIKNKAIADFQKSIFLTLYKRLER
ncbi:ArsR family transcriptional regulator [Candidatus Nomurabacteria bacterium]|nr:ArsR family transcriptional regulator [Candidatus Kaiserbacteria bacterium]MCB9814621.1 ArsR family transcriptional regulator [Candidatus Nomurabacteria bacterium]